MPIGHLIREIRPWEVPELKVEKFPSVPGVSQSDPNPRGGPTKGYGSICMEDSVVHSGLAVVNPLPGVSEGTANLNCKL